MRPSAERAWSQPVPGAGQYLPASRAELELEKFEPEPDVLPELELEAELEPALPAASFEPEGFWQPASNTRKQKQARNGVATRLFMKYPPMTMALAWALN